MSCPGDLLSGLVDGELDHGTRERVLSHLLACPPCSTEVQALRALKTRLSWAGAETPTPGDAFTARLLAMAVPGVDPAQRRTRGTVRPVTVRPAARSGHPGPRSRRVRRRTVGGCLVALGLTTAFVLGGSAGPARPNQVTVDPTTDVFVADYVDVTTELPLSEPVDAAVVGTAR